MIYNRPYNSTPVFDPAYIKKTEYRTLKKKSNGLGFFIFAYYMTMRVSYIILIAISTILMGNSEFLTSKDDPFVFILQTFIAVLSAFIPALLYLLISNSNISETICCKFVKPSVLMPFLCIGMAVAMFANYASDLVNNNFSFFGLENNVDFSSSSKSLINNILYVVSTAVVPAFAEEFAFRGILMGALRKYGDTFAIIASSVMFGAMHGNIVQIPFAFILGLVFAFIDCKTNSIIPSIIIHFINNFYSVIMDILENEGIISSFTFYLSYTIVISIFCILGIVSFIYIVKKKQNYLSIPQNKSVVPNLSLKEKNKAFFLSAGVITSSVFFIIDTISCLTIGG